MKILHFFITIFIVENLFISEKTVMGDETESPPPAGDESPPPNIPKANSGVPAERSNNEWIASLQWKTSNPAEFGNGHICAGVVIQRNKIATAGECFYKTKDYKLVDIYDLMWGIKIWNRFNNNCTIRNIVKVVTPKGFDASTLALNVAVSYLDKDISGDVFDSLNVPSIPTATSIFEPGTNCKLLGWGRLFEGGPLTAEPLTYEVVLLSNDGCYSDWSQFASNEQICGISTNPSSCNIDKGSPLICNNTFSGILHWTPSCDQNAYVSTVFSNCIRHRSLLEFNHMDVIPPVTHNKTTKSSGIKTTRTCKVVLKGFSNKIANNCVEILILTVFYTFYYV